MGKIKNEINLLNQNNISKKAITNPKNLLKNKNNSLKTKISFSLKKDIDIKKIKIKFNSFFKITIVIFILICFISYNIYNLLSKEKLKFQNLKKELKTFQKNLIYKLKN